MNRILDQHPAIAIMILSLAIKLLLLGFDQVINPDGVIYIAAAQQMADGDISGALKIYPMPAYPLLLTVMHFIIPDWIMAARIIGITALVLASIPLYGITTLLFNRQAAFWSTLCFSLTPEANEQALMVIRDPVFLLFTLAAILFFLKGIRQKDWRLISLALFMTILSFLFRIEGIVIAAAVVLFLFSKGFISKDTGFQNFSRRALAVWIGLPLALMIIIALLFGPQLLTQNRVGQLVQEANNVVQLKAFNNYQKIYDFLATIQSDPPFSGYSKSLPAIVRHWMPLIYLIGLMEYFVKQFFPLFLLPLLFAGYRFFSIDDRKIMREKQFVFLTWLVYILFILYSFIVRDFIQGRFLFTPAILLYPWVGHGITLVFRYFRGIRFRQIAQIAVIIVLIGLPCTKSVRDVVMSDVGALEAGRFISQDASLVNKKVLLSDPLLWLYGQRSEPFDGIKSKAHKVAKMVEKGNERGIEDQALRENAEALILAVNFKKTSKIPEFQRYEIYKKFPSRKGVSIIYRRTDRVEK